MPPRLYKWVNDEVSIFVQLDRPNPAEATTARYIGLGVKGTFCAEAQPCGANAASPTITASVPAGSTPSAAGSAPGSTRSSGIGSRTSCATRREERLLVASDADDLLAETPIPGVDVEGVVTQHERGQAVLRALQSLPPDQRRVLMLAYFGAGLTQVSIADYLDCPLGTVKKRTRLGLQKLRAVLEPTSRPGIRPQSRRRQASELRRRPRAARGLHAGCA